MVFPFIPGRAGFSVVISTGCPLTSTPMPCAATPQPSRCRATDKSVWSLTGWSRIVMPRATETSLHSLKNSGLKSTYDSDYGIVAYDTMYVVTIVKICLCLEPGFVWLVVRDHILWGAWTLRKHRSDSKCLVRVMRRRCCKAQGCLEGRMNIWLGCIILIYLIYVYIIRESMYK